jgi:signal peptidase I
MQFDFPTILFFLSVLTGGVWLVDAWLWKPARRRQAEAQPEEFQEEVLKEPWYVEYSRSFFPIIVIVLILRSFLVEPFRIPSGSMMPTLLNGDFILVNKFAYGIKLPVINKKIIDTGNPQRGDVIVFRFPEDPSKDYIKRVIGIPGDRIAYRNNRVYLNGKQLKYSHKGTFVGSGVSSEASGATEMVEQAGKARHRILLGAGTPAQYYKCLANGPYTVPKDHYFVMGDNRDNSYDSRFWCAVPEKNLVGKAFMIWFNWDPVRSGITWNRIGTIIK